MDENSSHNNELLIPEIDRDFLHEKGYEFQVIPEGKSLYLILSNFSLPASVYTPATVDLMIAIPEGYPNAQLDMFWTNPDVKLLNGNWPLKADHHGTFCERTWQRWSRHIQGEAPWRVGVDNIRSFLSTIRKELDKGL